MSPIEPEPIIETEQCPRFPGIVALLARDEPELLSSLASLTLAGIEKNHRTFYISEQALFDKTVSNYIPRNALPDGEDFSEVISLGLPADYIMRNDKLDASYAARMLAALCDQTAQYEFSGLRVFLDMEWIVWDSEAHSHISHLLKNIHDLGRGRNLTVFCFSQVSQLDTRSLVILMSSFESILYDGRMCFSPILQPVHSQAESAGEKDLLLQSLTTPRHTGFQKPDNHNDNLGGSETLFQAIAENLDLIVFHTDKLGSFRGCNRQFEIKTGWCEIEVVGRNAFDFLLPSHEVESMKSLYLSTIGMEGFPSQFENQIVARSGEKKVVAWNTVTLRNAAGELTGAGFLGHDLTAQRKLEQQYRQSQKMEAVGQLAGGVAHDFNNLISVVLGYSEMLLDDLPENPGLKDVLQEIIKAATSAKAVTQQLLMFSRLQMLDLRVMNPNQIVHDVSKMLRRLLGETINLVVKLDLDLGNILCDSGQIQQALMNLAVNARDAMPDGGSLTIATMNQTIVADEIPTGYNMSPGNHIVITVTDTGSGIPWEVQKQMFDPFFTTKAVGNGTGLGLSTVKDIIQQHKGGIRLLSESGIGTTFLLYFPAVDLAAPEQPVASVVRPRMAREETILVTEDEETVRKLATAILKKQGYKVLEARGPHEAIGMFEQYMEQIDLLLTDVIMPWMDGKSLYERLKTSSPNLKVVFMSGYSGQVLTQKGLVENERYFIQKPFGLESLLQIVREALDEDNRDVRMELPHA